MSKRFWQTPVSIRALFQERQLKLLRLPQNLSLFLEAGFDASHAPTFGTAKELFDRYWTKKRELVEARVAPLPDQWMEVVQTLCNEMTATQQLSVPMERLDGVPVAYLHQLASEGVITFDGRRYGFGHESFFDYCFARVFFNQPKSLVSFLKESEQHLFRRAQVRQALAYLRDADADRYVQELHSLLSDEGIRTHIKDLALALLADATNPTDAEWGIWKEWITPQLEAIKEGTPNQDKLSALAWRRFFGSPSWFTFADENTTIRSWLASSDGRIADLAVNYLRAHQRHCPDRVAALIEPYADHGGEWIPRLRSLVEWGDHCTSRRFFDLFLSLVANGTLDQARGPIVQNSTFWSMLHNLGENRPEWVPEVLAQWLQRRILVMCSAGEDLGNGKLIGYDDSASWMLRKSAEQAPVAFVEHVLPMVLDLSDATLIPGEKPPRRDAVWPFLMKTEYPSGDDAYLSGLTGALAAIARDGGTDLDDVISDLRRRDTHIANHLLLSLFRGGSVRYADEAVSLFCDEPWRFQCGFSDSPNWCAMETIHAVVFHCSAGNLEKLETVMLHYVSPSERTSYGYKQTGETRFALLSAIPADRRNAGANAHFAELSRKFGEPYGEPRGIEGGFIESPIELTAACKMTDGQWLRAIMKYSSEDCMPVSGDRVKGGAPQLAQVLQTRVKGEPDRFARLCMSLPPDANPVYLERTLDALKNAATRSDLKLQVCRKAFAEAPERFGRSIADVLGNMEDPLPEEGIRMLQWLVTEPRDPASEAWQENAGGGRTYHNGDIHVNGINTTRGRAAEAVRDLILKDTGYIDRFRDTLDRMIRDPSAAVLSCVAGTLRAIASHDVELSIQLFLRMNLTVDRLLATVHIYALIRVGLCDYYAELLPIVERMLRSSEPEICEAGARLASIAAALEHTDAERLVDEALRGDPRRRLGVAQVASANIAIPECRAWAEARLPELFNDDDPAVRSEAASCFRYLKDETLETYSALIDNFCDSRAYLEGSSSLLNALTVSLKRLPGITCKVCERFLDRFAEEARDMRTSRVGDAHTAAELIFRTYTAAPGRRMDTAVTGSDRPPLPGRDWRRGARV